MTCRWWWRIRQLCSLCGAQPRLRKLLSGGDCGPDLNVVNKSRIYGDGRKHAIIRRQSLGVSAACAAGPFEWRDLQTMVRALVGGEPGFGLPYPGGGQ